MINGYSAKTSEECLILKGGLSELNRIPPWIEGLASLHAIPESTQFAIDLCLEEVVSNVIRHGYKSAGNGVVHINCTARRDGYITLVVEDDAPLFNPLAYQIPPAPSSIEDVPEGGRGILLLRQFADTVDYQALLAGNRLTIGFLSLGASPASE